MADKSSIEWTDATWNPTTGCQQISPGCDHCYARTLAGRFWAHQYPPNPDGSARQFEDVRMHPDRLTLPLTWKEPRRVFVDSMSDLFNDDVPDDFIAQVFAVMALTPRHTYQVLTKRPQRMQKWFVEPRPLETTEEYVAWWGEHLSGISNIWDARGSNPDTYAHIPGLPGRYGSKERAAYLANRRVWPGWPLPNVWLGTSIELDRYGWRANYLRETPAAVRFISAEPLLGPLPNLDLTGLDWIITGGESGPGHRPCDPQWVRDLRDRCRIAGVAMFHKQWGGQTPKAGGRLLDGRTHDEFPAAGVPS